MHPRNIYNKPPDFDELAKLFPDFAKVAHLDITGRVKIDFKNPEAVWALSRCCLLKDFNLNVELPPDKLLPTIPLRLNYLHWTEDLLEHCEVKSDVSGVDIGCGASCIYCLLAVRMNCDWKMFALEIDDKNVKFSRENVSRNHLKALITVVAQEGSEKIFKKLFEHDPQQKTFCICNPPFFNSTNEVTNASNRTGKRKAPKSLHSGSPHELVFEDGGELGFVRKILSESIELQNKIQIYSTMLGCKKNLLKFIEELKSQNIQSFTTTEFVQGKTTRWGIAWSFAHDLRSFKLPKVAAKNFQTPKNVLKHEIVTANFDETVSRLRTIFDELKIEIKVIDESSECHRWELKVTLNTWSNQRRRKRAELKSGQDSTSSVVANPDELNIAFEVRKEAKKASIQTFYLSGSMSKDCVNQILQFIKNKFK